MTFIADERFQSFYVESTGLWTLQIKYVQVSEIKKIFDEIMFDHLFSLHRLVMLAYMR